METWVYREIEKRIKKFELDYVVWKHNGFKRRNSGYNEFELDYVVWKLTPIILHCASMRV